MGGSFIDLDSGDAIPDAVVLVRDGRVAEIGKRGYVGSPDGADTIDAAGGWILPGLINLHAHFTLDAGVSPSASMDAEPLLLTAMRAAGHASEALRAGVTTVRELGSRAGLAIELRQAIALGYVPGPRVFAAGLAITMSGGHGMEVGRQADGQEEIRRAVREQVAHGADLIKIMASGGVARPGERAAAKGLTVEEMRAGVDEAHRAGLRTTAHALPTDGIRDALEAGLDCIEHGIVLDDAAVATMKERDVPLVSTLAVHQALFRAPEGNRYLDSHKVRAAGLPEKRKASFQRAVAAGVRIGAGSDAGTVLNRHDDFVTELEQMVEAGISPLDAVRAATCWAARILGRDDVGRLSKGAHADVIVAADDPRRTVSALRNLRLVMKGGIVASCSA